MTDDKPKPTWDFRSAMETQLQEAIKQAELYRDAMYFDPPTPEQERDYYRAKFLRMRQKRNNKRQTLAALRLRHQELVEDYAAMRQERDSIRDAWEDLSIELEQLKQKVYQEEEE